MSKEEHGNYYVCKICGSVHEQLNKPNGQPNTSDNIREILEDLVMGTLGKHQPKFTETGSLSDYEQAITAHTNQAVLQARIDELERTFANPEWEHLKVGQISSVNIFDFLSDRTEELTSQLEQEQK